MLKDQKYVYTYSAFARENIELIYYGMWIVGYKNVVLMASNGIEHKIDHN